MHETQGSTEQEPEMKSWCAASLDTRTTERKRKKHSYEKRLKRGGTLTSSWSSEGCVTGIIPQSVKVLW